MNGSENPRPERLARTSTFEDIPIDSNDGASRQNFTKPIKIPVFGTFPKWEHTCYLRVPFSENRCIVLLV